MEPAPQAAQPSAALDPSPQLQRLALQPNAAHHNPRAINPAIQLDPVELGIFGRLDSDFRILDHVFQVGLQVTLPTAVWQQIHQLTVVDLPITEDNFIRMWKTLLLKRVQDVFEQEKHHRADHFIRITRNMVVPAPLADLLYAIGSYYDPNEGVRHHIIPPARPAEPEPWWTIDNAILGQWDLCINRMQDAFVMKEFPSPSNYEGRPLFQTSIDDTADGRAIRARYRGPTPADAYLRAVNDELFADPYPIADCAFSIVEPTNRVHIIHEYLRKYVRERQLYR